MSINDFIHEIESIDWLKNANHIDNVLETEFEWEWLPTSRDQDDPFKNNEASNKNNQPKNEINKVYKAALKSLRSIGESHAKLQNGPHDYTEAFKGAALFACKYAAREYLSSTRGKWVEIFNFYKEGRWPCGLKKNGTLVLL